ncbi:MULTISPECIES: SMC-Scp complex subunit ScpB [Asticcacaulis]|uniref:SMC-Scp complex subunit ScpB n=1 Tax=Asticcacaulis TaxID=76890 RepID=UPI001AE0F1B9|nr:MULTISPECIES: SMC-Scp complex subunit ScpB [Asticcacaulis]MBP2158544.1 segregation and condensation protein B [Asticcacaulis solisilvae]MDR6799590.1 segregation and condensation protein B [Asticcacaulis sp. BE141]
MKAEDVERAIEALLFAAAGPLSAAELAYRLPEGADIGKALAGLKARYAGRGVSLEVINDRWQFRTAADLAFLMVEEREEPRKLSKAALETLAIIAYHQPVTRAEIEMIRGVGLSRGTLDVLHEMNLIKLRGRRKTPGRPVAYGTTDAFLEQFSLPSLSDLPGVAEMRAAGLLDINVPADFMVPDPSAPQTAEDAAALDDMDEIEFAQDFFEEKD